MKENKDSNIFLNMAHIGLKLHMKECRANSHVFFFFFFFLVTFVFFSEHVCDYCESQKKTSV